MSAQRKNEYNTAYTGPRLNRVAFPLGGIGAGMICLEGTGAFSHVSIRNKPEMYNWPCVFAAVTVKGRPGVARVLEGPVPDWKKFGAPGTGNGAAVGRICGLPHFSEAAFGVRFPFATVALADEKIPLAVKIIGYSPFIPNDADNSSLPAAVLEYHFSNHSGEDREAVFSFHCENFLATGDKKDRILARDRGFVLHHDGSNDKPFLKSDFCAVVDDAQAKINYTWFRGGCFDSLTMVWNDIESGACYSKGPREGGQESPGASIFVPMTVGGGGEKIIKLLLCWYVPTSDVCFPSPNGVTGGAPEHSYQPWYAGRFSGIEEVWSYVSENEAELRIQSETFSKCFYDATLPDEVMEAVGANLTILKSPSVLRQRDGRLWGYEGCADDKGCCPGSCSHVWNYAQAVCHLFGALERSLRETEFQESQDERGHQVFRATLPIGPCADTGPQSHEMLPAADGQLGGIMKIYRDWRISGDTSWLERLWPKVKKSLSYCIDTWDPQHKGVLSEPHHNTYDIEFWGPDPMCSSFYLGALKAAMEIGQAVSDEEPLYGCLLERGQEYFAQKLFNGEYYRQIMQTEGLKAKGPLETKSLLDIAYSPEAIALVKQEGPKYQYGEGCLSDGILGVWMARVCGLGDILDKQQVKSHLKSIYQYNLKRDLSEHANPQRAGYALGKEGGLLLCTWPKGGRPSLPFIYSNEVWTGIEYQVASHLMMEGMVEQGLEIVRICRKRYDGVIRNPFNEYECGHWYVRAMSSYALLQGLTGIRYDAVERVLYMRPAIGGDFRSFLSTARGYATVGLRQGKPFIEIKSGEIPVERIDYVAI